MSVQYYECVGTESLKIDATTIAFKHCKVIRTNSCHSIDIHKPLRYGPVSVFGYFF
jgi:hypothetical protein